MAGFLTHSALHAFPFLFLNSGLRNVKNIEYTAAGTVTAFDRIPSRQKILPHHISLANVYVFFETKKLLKKNLTNN